MTAATCATAERSQLTRARRSRRRHRRLGPASRAAMGRRALSPPGSELPETYEYLQRLEAALGKQIARLNSERGFDHWLWVYQGAGGSPPPPGDGGSSSEPHDLAWRARAPVVLRTGAVGDRQPPVPQDWHGSHCPTPAVGWPAAGGSPFVRQTRPNSTPAGHDLPSRPARRQRVTGPRRAPRGCRRGAAARKFPDRVPGSA
jgi:hypothetical protein